MSEPGVRDFMQRLDEHLKLDNRLDSLESRVTILEQCMRNLETIPDILTDLRITVGEKFGALSTQSRVTWALLILILGGLIGLAYAYLKR